MKSNHHIIHCVQMHFGRNPQTKDRVKIEQGNPGNPGKVIGNTSIALGITSQSFFCKVRNACE